MLMVENRDNHIGWGERERLRGLKHLAVVSSCVATQPFGFNFLGGKLLASLCSSNTIRDLWKQKYGDEVTVKAPMGDILYEILEVQYI
jgi:hypothetical protein